VRGLGVALTNGSRGRDCALQLAAALAPLRRFGICAEGVILFYKFRDIPIFSWQVESTEKTVAAW
jgi:hypothetical protein